MRAYVAATGLVFALILAAHAARLVAEGPALLREPVFALSTALSLGAVAWALAMWVRGRR